MGRKKKIEEIKPVATLRDGSTLTIGSEVETRFHEKCDGVIFVVCKITPYAHCQSGFLVLVHVKDYPERLLKSSMSNGIDTNWFTKIN